MAFTSEILAVGDKTWAKHGLRFATESEARRFAVVLSLAWLRAPEIRVIETPEPATHKLTDGGLLLQLEQQ